MLVWCNGENFSIHFKINLILLLLSLNNVIVGFLFPCICLTRILSFV